MALTTQCPQCGAAFKVVADQLRVRNGLVRCGVCTAVFDGRAHLQPEPADDSLPVLRDRVPEPPPPWSASPSSPLAPVSPRAPAYEAPPVPLAPRPPVAPVPPATVRPALPAAPEVFRGRDRMARPEDEDDVSQDADLADDVRRHHPPLDAAEVWRGRPATTPQAPTAPPVQVAPPIQTAPTAPIYGEVRRSAPEVSSRRTEPATTRYRDRYDNRPEHPPIQVDLPPSAHRSPAAWMPSAATPAAGTSAVTTPAAAAAAPVMAATVNAPSSRDAADAWHHEPDPVLDNDRSTQDHAGDWSGHGRADESSGRYQADDWSVQGESRTRYVDDPLPGRTAPEFMDEGVQARRDTRARGWGTACLLMIVVLMLQAAYVWRTQLATRAPALRPVLEAACRSLSCEVGHERRIERISIMSSSLAPADGAAAPEGTQRLVLRVVLRNRYNVAQPWPALTLQLKDLSDTDVVRKTILPQDYLPVDAVRTAFAANGERTIVLPMTVRNAQVNGYQLEKFFP